jgi:hypothetical protein
MKNETKTQKIIQKVAVVLWLLPLLSAFIVGIANCIKEGDINAAIIFGVSVPLGVWLGFKLDKRLL